MITFDIEQDKALELVSIAVKKYLDNIVNEGIAIAKNHIDQKIVESLPTIEAAAYRSLSEYGKGRYDINIIIKAIIGEKSRFDNRK